MGTELDQALLDRMIEASTDRAGSGSGTVVLETGKKTKAVLEIEDGQLVGGLAGEAALEAIDGPGGAEGGLTVTVPMTGRQLEEFLDGSSSLARAYMMGDVKPVGATGALLALVELFESDGFRSSL